jgi:hypothetical protein
LDILGKPNDRLQGEDSSVGLVFVGHHGYPWTFLHIEVDEQGHGKGLIVLFAKVVFNQAGRMVVESMGARTGNAATARLVDVHSVK